MPPYLKGTLCNSVNVSSLISFHAVDSKHKGLAKRELLRWGLPQRLSGKESACQYRRHGFDPWSGKIATSPGATKPMYHDY